LSECPQKTKEKTDIFTFITICSLGQMAVPTLSAWDYVLLVILLLSSAVIGAVFGFVKSKKNSAREFLLGTHLKYFFV